MPPRNADNIHSEVPFGNLQYHHNPNNLPNITTYDQYCGLTDVAVSQYLQVFELRLQLNVRPRTTLAKRPGINIGKTNEECKTINPIKSEILHGQLPFQNRNPHSLLDIITYD